MSRSEVEIFEKEGLFPSYTLLRDEKDQSRVIAHGVYIYRPNLPIEPFLTISRELGRLNNYCIIQYSAVENEVSSKVDIYNQNVDELMKSEVRQDKDDWEYHQQITSKVVPILLITSFVEWSLRKISKSYLGDDKVRQKNSLSKIESYLLTLEDAGLYSDSLGDLDAELLKSLRKIRNAYAHGEYDKVTEVLRGLRLGACFSVVSHILTACEKNCIHRDHA